MLRRASLVAACMVALSCTPADPTSRRAVETATPAPSPSPEPTPPLDVFALARSYLFSEPAELAAALVEAELAIRSEGAKDEDLAEHSPVQQAAYRQLVVEPSWLEAVVAAAPQELRPVIRANVEAGAELRALTEPRDELPDWRIVAPPPAEELQRYYEEAEGEFGVPWYYLASVHLVETRMGRIRGESTAGARGPMQFLPSTWARWGSGDIEDARDSILAAARYLNGHGAPANMPGALYAYNRSQRYVVAITNYAEIMRDEPLAYRGYYHWAVYYRTTQGDALLEVGWSS